MGTFSKAFGVCGAFVATTSEAASLITSQARSLLYTTAPPAPLAEATMKSLEIVRNGEPLRRELARNITLFRTLAEEAHLSMMPSNTPIQPLVIGDAEKTMKVSASLWEEGYFVQGIRPPTVKEGTSRLRITLTAKHDESQIQALVAALKRALSQLGEP
jgi:8-amino-7-oxononanoate synthase